MSDAVKITFPDGAVKEFPKWNDNRGYCRFNQFWFKEKGIGWKAEWRNVMI